MRTEELDCNYALVFSENDIKHNFIACVAKVIVECNDAQILVERGSDGRISRIAEVLSTYENGKTEWRVRIEKDIAAEFGIEEEMSDTILDLAVLLRNKISLDIEKSLEMAILLSENFDIKRK